MLGLVSFRSQVNFFVDPQGFWDLLGKLPWHADTLQQVAEVYRHREGNFDRFVRINAQINEPILLTSRICASYRFC